MMQLMKFSPLAALILPSALFAAEVVVTPQTDVAECLSATAEDDADIDTKTLTLIKKVRNKLKWKG